MARLLPAAQSTHIHIEAQRETSVEGAFHPFPCDLITSPSTGITFRSSTIVTFVCTSVLPLIPAQLLTYARPPLQEDGMRRGSCFSK